MPGPTVHLGASSALGAGGPLSSFLLRAHHVVTHGVVVGMTGGGTTDALTVLCEEARSSGEPVLEIDVEGDLPNLLLSLPTTDAAAFLPWSAGIMGSHDDRPPGAVVAFGPTAGRLARSLAFARSLVRRPPCAPRGPSPVVTGASRAPR